MILATALCLVHASHNPDISLLVPTPLEQYLEPDYDTFQYITAIYPTLDTYTAGQYVRVRLTVSGTLRDGTALSTQEGKWQWLNTSYDEAGLMVIKHYVNNQVGKGINYCNATAEADVLMYETDLGVAGGTLPAVGHSSVSASNVVCGYSDTTCARDPNGQSLDAFATFMLPYSFDGPFRLCYRKSRSSFSNDTSELGWWTNSETDEIKKLLAENTTWAALHSSLRHHWQEPDTDMAFYMLNSSAEYYWEAGTMRAGEHAVLKIHKTPESSGYQSASTDEKQSDQVKLVPSGQDCITETEDGRYPGTVLASSAGVWDGAAFDNDLIAMHAANGSFAPRQGYVSGTSEKNPHRSSDWSYSVTSASTTGVWYILAFLQVAEGDWDVCYSTKSDREVGTAIYTTGGSTYLSAKRQAPGGWRKIPNGYKSSATTLTVVAKATGIDWASSDVTAGSWGVLELSGATVDGSTATTYDTSSSKSYEKLVGGDHVRLVHYESTVINSIEAQDGCWSTQLGTESHDLLGTPSYSGLWDPTAALQALNNGQSDRYFYLNFPSRGKYAVCYRPVGGFWVALDRILETELVPYNVTWNINDTRATTWGAVNIVSTDFPMITQPYDKNDPRTVAVIVAPSGTGCLPDATTLAAGTFTPSAFVNDVGNNEVGPNEELTQGRFSSDLVLRYTVAAWIFIPSYGSSYVVCFKKSGRNWQALYNSDGTLYLTPNMAPGLDYEIQDTRIGTFGMFSFQAHVVDATTSAWSLSRELNGRDTLKLVSNHTMFFGCDRSSLLDQGVVAAVNAAKCTATSSSTYSSCYFEWVEDFIGYNTERPNQDAFDGYQFATLPNADVALWLCYQQYGKNWIRFDKQIYLEPPHGISLQIQELSLSGGTWYDFQVSTTGMVKFDLGNGKDEAKLILANQECHYTALQNAKTADFTHPTDTSKNDLSGQTHAVVSFTLPNTDTPIDVRLCIRQYLASGRNNWVKLQDNLLVKPSGIKYTLDTSVVTRGLAHFRFISKAMFDTRPGRDMFKLIPSTQYCRSENSYHQSPSAAANDVKGIVNIGPDDTKGVATSKVTTVIPSAGGSYRVCYFLSGNGNWFELVEETNATRITAVGLAPGTQTAGATGLISTTRVGITGIDMGSSLFSSEGLINGTYAVVGGLETSVVGSEASLLKVLGTGFDPANDQFKLIMTQIQTASGWVPTGEDCRAAAVPLTETSSFTIGSGWVAPTMAFPQKAGKYAACYLWGSIPAPTWVVVPITTLSSTAPYNTVAANDELTVVAPLLYFSESSGAIGIQDYYVNTTSSPSLSTADGVRIIAAHKHCQDITTASQGANGSATLNLSKNSEQIEFLDSISTITLVDWPPSQGNTSFKVCYRKASMIDSAGRMTRVPCCTWVVVPNFDSEPYLATTTPQALHWVNEPPSSVIVGNKFTVTVQAVGTGGVLVPGRRLIAFYDMGPNGLCGAGTPRVCNGLGSQALSWQCDSAIDAARYNWAANNTIVSTDETGLATLTVQWLGECENCILSANLLMNSGVGTVPAIFDAVSPLAVQLSCPTLDAASLFLDGATPLNPWHLEHQARLSFEITALTEVGTRAFGASGTPLRILAVKGGDAFASASLLTSTTKLASGGNFVFQTSLESNSKADLQLGLVPKASFTKPVTLVMNITSSSLPFLIASLQISPIIPVMLMVVSVTPLNMFPLPPSWQAAGWPQPLVGWKMRAGVLNESTAESGYYLMQKATYVIELKPLDASGRHAPVSGVNKKNVLVSIASSTGATPHTVLSQTVSAEGHYLVTLVVNAACYKSNPCVLVFDADGASASVTTPVRAMAVKLVLTSAPSLVATPDTPLGPFEFQAVNENNEKDEWHLSRVWPLIAGGDGLQNENGVSVVDSAKRKGVQLSAMMHLGVVTFSDLRLSAPCLNTSIPACKINFVSTSGLFLYETDLLRVTDNAYKLSGTVNIQSSTVTAQAWFSITLTVLDMNNAATGWVREWVMATQESGAASFVIKGGRSQRMHSSTVVLWVKFITDCKGCSIRFRANYRDGWWTADPSRSTWVTPSIDVTTTPQATKLVLSQDPYYSNGNGSLERVVTSSTQLTEGRVWFMAPRDMALVFPIVSVDDYMVPSYPNSSEASAKIQISVKKLLGDDLLDGTGGSYVTDPLVVRASGIQLQNAKGQLTVTFPTPCLQCLLTLKDTTNVNLASLDILITVLPVPTGLVEWSKTVPTALETFGGEAPSDSAVWMRPLFVLTDGNTIAYTAPVDVSLKVSLPVHLSQTLTCLTCDSPTGTKVHRHMQSHTVLEHIKVRLNNEVSPNASFVVAGTNGNLNGSLVATVEGTSLHWVSSNVAWKVGTVGIKLEVLTAAVFVPDWLGYKLQSTEKGYLKDGVFPPYAYMKGSVVPGVSFPLTVQVKTVNNTIATTASGEVTATLLPSKGCGSGLPLTQTGGNVINGNTTIWLKFGSSCEACIVHIMYTPCSTCPSLPASERTRTLDPINVIHVPYTDIIIGPQTRVPHNVTTEEVFVVELRAVAYSNGVPFTCVTSSPTLYLFNDLASPPNPSTLWLGNGGHLATPGGQEYPQGLPVQLRGGAAVISFKFSRPCTACSILVVNPHLNTSFHLRTNTPHVTPDNIAITVKAVGTQRITTALAPSIWRRAPFALVEIVVNVLGDRDYEAVPGISVLVRSNIGGNGDGGTLMHTNGGKTLSENEWVEGALVWRLEFTSSCYSCDINVNGKHLSIAVYTPAVGLQVVSMEPTSGIVTLGKPISFKLRAVDEEGNRDYSMNAFGNLLLSPYADKLAAPLLPQLGMGGNMLFSGVDRVPLTEGESPEFVTTFTEPTFASYVHFFIYPSTRDVTSKLNPQQAMPTPPIISVVTTPENFTVLNATGAILYEGNVFEIWVGLVDRGGWIATGGSGWVEIAAACNSTNISVAGGTRQQLTNGFLKFAVTARGIAASTSSTPKCTFTFLLQDYEPTELIANLSNVTASVLSFAEKTPPTHAVQGRPLVVRLQAYDDEGRLAVGPVGWVGIVQVSCTSGTVTTNNQTLQDGGATFSLLFSGVGVCQLKLMAETLPVWNDTSGSQVFTVAVQNLIDIEFLSNITSETTPVLLSGVAYPLHVRVVDDYGKVVGGDVATKVSVEIMTGPYDMMLLNTNTATLVNPLAPSTYAKRTPQVTVINGEYVFQLMFSMPTNGTFLRIQVIADFGLPNVAPAVASSEVIQVVTEGTALRFTGRVPAYWVVGRPFQLYVTIVDSVGNIPSGPQGQRRITMGGGTSSIRLHSPRSFSVVTSSTQVLYNMTWVGGQGVAAFEASSTGLLPARSSVRFQTITGIAVSASNLTVLSHYAMSVGVVLVDHLGDVVQGDSSTTVHAAVAGQAMLRTNTILQKQVVNGAVGFEFFFTGPGQGNTVTFTVRDPPLEHVVGPFDVISGRSTPPPPTLVKYTPPLISLNLNSSRASFDAQSFTAILSSAMGYKQDTVIVVWVCDVTNGVKGTCDQISSVAQMLISASRGAAVLQRRSQAQAQSLVSGIEVGFQVLPSAQGPLLTHTQADSFVSSTASALEQALTDPTNPLQEDVGWFPSNVTVTPLQATPAPVTHTLTPWSPPTQAPPITPGPYGTPEVSSVVPVDASCAWTAPLQLCFTLLLFIIVF